MNPLATAFVFLLCFSWGRLSADTATNGLRLAGIIDLPGWKQALVQDVPSRFGIPTSLLREGEREGDLEVSQIDSEKGTVKVLWAGTPELLRFKNKAEAGRPAAALTLEDAELASVLYWYGAWAGKSVLQFPSIPPARLTLRESAADLKNAALVLEKALKSRGIAIIPDSQKFAFVVPEDKVDTLLRRPHPAKPAGSPGDDDAILQPGMLYFHAVDARQVVRFYGELVGRQFQPGETLQAASGTVSFRSQTPLSRQEAAYALDTLFAWHGFEVIPVGETSLKCVRIQAPVR